jgi:hypothetical protein
MVKVHMRNRVPGGACGMAHGRAVLVGCPKDAAGCTPSTATERQCRMACGTDSCAGPTPVPAWVSLTFHARMVVSTASTKGHWLRALHSGFELLACWPAGRSLQWRLMTTTLWGAWLPVAALQVWRSSCSRTSRCGCAH